MFRGENRICGNLKNIMKIAITMRCVENNTYSETRDALSREWTEYMAKIMPKVILIPVLNDPDAVLDFVKNLDVDGVILSGGNDWGSDSKRDETETKLFKYAFKKKLPILGVCRGFQVLNLLMEGKLEKNIKKISGENHTGVFHSIYIEKKSPFGKIVKKNELKINSYHNQGVLLKDLSPELRAFALSPKGVVEGFYHPSRLIIGIQWHPERKNPSADFDKKLILNLFAKR